jgi:hypothetical protein
MSCVVKMSADLKIVSYILLKYRNIKDDDRMYTYSLYYILCKCPFQLDNRKNGESIFIRRHEFLIKCDVEKSLYTSTRMMMMYSYQMQAYIGIGTLLLSVCPRI